jgi:hypothetical protein
MEGPVPKHIYIYRIIILLVADLEEVEARLNCIGEGH